MYEKNVEYLLECAMKNECSSDMLLCLLSVTLPMRDRLSNRKVFLEYVRKVLIKRNEEDVPALLEGL